MDTVNFSESDHHHYHDNRINLARIRLLEHPTMFAALESTIPRKHSSDLVIRRTSLA